MRTWITTAPGSAPAAPTTLLDPLLDPLRPPGAAEPAGLTGTDGAELRIRLDARRFMRRPTAAPRVSVVIPAKNEEHNLPAVLAELPPGLHEVVLVDGASEDDTVSAALRARPDLVVVEQTRHGKGNALACGFAACTGDVIVMLDADGSADPREIPAFVAALTAGCDFAKGSRFLPGGGSDDLTPVRRLGNWALALTMNSLYGTSYTDLCYGYNAFWRRCVARLELPEVDGDAPRLGDGFEIETLLAAHAASARLTVAEVPSFERPRRHGQSHLNTWRDGWRVLRTILRERLFPARVRQRLDEAPSSRATQWPAVRADRLRTEPEARPEG